MDFLIEMLIQLYTPRQTNMDMYVKVIISNNFVFFPQTVFFRGILLTDIFF